MWIMTNTRPDIAFAVHQIARRTADPRPSDWIALKRILRYLRGTPTKGILYKRSETSIQCFSDSDWAGDSSRRTTACSLIYFGGAIIHWQVRLLKSIALSSMEAELMTYSETGKLGLFIKHLIEDMGLKDKFINGPIPIFGDNDAARLAISRISQTPRTRHIETRHFWVREQVAARKFSMKRIASNDNPADIGTKPFTGKRFQFLRDKMVQDFEQVIN
jgi:hypothetical protein